MFWTCTPNKKNQWPVVSWILRQNIRISNFLCQKIWKDDDSCRDTQFNLNSQRYIHFISHDRDCKVSWYMCAVWMYLAIGRKHYVSELRKAMVKALTENGKSQSNIARQIASSQSAVARIFEELRIGHGVTSCRKNSGWKRITMSRDDGKVADIARWNRISKTLFTCETKMALKHPGLQPTGVFVNLDIAPGCEPWSISWIRPRGGEDCCGPKREGELVCGTVINGYGHRQINILYLLCWQASLGMASSERDVSLCLPTVR